MGEETDFENGRISDFQGLMTLTLDRVILHTVMCHSQTSTYIPNFIEIKETFCGRTDLRTDRQTFETGSIRSTRRSPPNRLQNELILRYVQITFHMATEFFSFKYHKTEKCYINQ